MMEQPHQGHGDHWECLFENTSVFVEDWLRTLVREGSLEPPTCRIEKPGDAAGIAYPATPLRGLALVTAGEDANELASAYPWAARGVRRRMVVEEIIPWDNGIEAWITASFPGDDGHSLTFFDTRYYAGKDRVRVGLEADFVLAGLAYFAEVIEPAPVFITNPETIRAMRATSDQADDTSPIEVRLNGAAILFPRDDLAPSDYEFQVPVKEVEHFTVFDRTVTRITATVTRLTGRDDEDVDVDFYVAAERWRRNARPLPGADIRGAVWLQGYLAD